VGANPFPFSNTPAVSHRRINGLALSRDTPV
jgi:hypothetical protein